MPKDLTPSECLAMGVHDFAVKYDLNLEQTFELLGHMLALYEASRFSHSLERATHTGSELRN